MSFSEPSSRDLSPLISCLVQLMADKRYRTLHGFEELIEREWVALGHDFTHRLGLVLESSSPVINSHSDNSLDSDNTVLNVTYSYSLVFSAIILLNATLCVSPGT